MDLLGFDARTRANNYTIMNWNLTLALLVFSGASLQAQDEEKKPRDIAPPEPEVPTVSEGKAKLTGTWILDNTSFAKAIITSLGKSGPSGTNFEFTGIKGDYVATINTETMKVLVDWHQWEMLGVAHTTRAGDFPVVVNLNGQQQYTIASIGEGETPGDRKMVISLTKDAARAKVSFKGIVTQTKMDIPQLGSGQWTVLENKFYLQSEGQVWNFTRKEHSIPKP
jgi:hypothetical protein